MRVLLGDSLEVELRDAVFEPASPIGPKSTAKKAKRLRNKSQRD